jgi:deferrochelatase/peroxidase EfeB
MPVDLNDTRIDVNAPPYQRLLTNLQGNILKGHGRDFTVHIFAHFTGDMQAVRTGFTTFADDDHAFLKRQARTLINALGGYEEGSVGFRAKLPFWG